MTTPTPPTLTPTQISLRQAAIELQWLKRNPDFAERPASIVEFLGEDYLNIAKGVRDGVKECLVAIFGEEPNVYNLALVQRAMFTGGIGIGKTTFASIALPYMCHWCLCLKDPQSFFGLLPGSRIAFMQMSTSETQAKEVLFGDIFARIRHSKWFKKFPYDDKFKNQIRFPKDIWIVPGDSSETTFEGYNILGGIIDEIDSHKVTDKKDYAESGYDTIHARITSRFQNRGLLILIGQMKKSVGFAAKKYKEFVEEGPEGGAFAKKLSIWESLGWERFLKSDGTRDSFWFDVRRKEIVSDIIADVVGHENLMEIPNVYRKDFTNNPQKALRDHAGIPPLVGDAFISMVDKVDLCRTKWHERFNVAESPVLPNLSRPQFQPWFMATDTLPRAVHIDIAYSATGDALGLAMGHVRELKEVDDEIKPVIVFDCLIRMRPLPGRQIILSDVRQIVYDLKTLYGFKIRTVSLDGFQSTDTLQQFQKKKFQADYLSVDKNVLPYHDLREAIYEGRLEFPRYMTYMRHGDTVKVEIAVQELIHLVETNTGKIDHPDGGSKDVTDAMAGVCTTLMGDRRYRRGISLSASSSPTSTGSGSFEVPGFKLDTPISQDLGSLLPAMPSMPSLPNVGTLGSYMPYVPEQLRPK